MNKILIAALMGAWLISGSIAKASQVEEGQAALVQQSKLPQINIDAFDKDAMEDVLVNWGTFELVGPSVDTLRDLRHKALEKARVILHLPIEELEKVTHKTDTLLTVFHGFQNVMAASIASYDKSIAEGRKPFDKQKQIAFHQKPYLCMLAPEGQHVQEFHDYYYTSRALLVRLYNLICDHFIRDESFRSDLSDHVGSAMSSRRYFAEESGDVQNGWTGIRAHSDHGILTMVISNQVGLEVLHDGQWVASPAGEDHAIINIGDWTQMQTRLKFLAGIHRVQCVPIERTSIAIFLNPNFNEKRITPSGIIATFNEYLKERDKFLATK